MDIVDQLKKSGMPPPLIHTALTDTVPEAFADKLERVKHVIKETQKRVIIIIGNDSPAKDQFSAALMKWYMLYYNKTGRWLYPAKGLDEEEFGNAGITCVSAFDLLGTMVKTQIASLIRERVLLERTFILCTTAGDRIEKELGEVFWAYLSHIALLVRVEQAIQPFVEI